jgi:hypothetical protein
MHQKRIFNGRVISSLPCVRNELLSAFASRLNMATMQMATTTVGIGFTKEEIRGLRVN